jgi:hypothetical protein
MQEADIVIIGPRMKIRQLLLALFLSHVTGLPAQPASRPKLTPRQAEELSALMCRQLPNIGTILENKVEIPSTAPAGPPQEPIVTDDVYDALVQLGPYSLQCLTDKLLDDRWMPDPRSEPLLGSPVVGDVVYMVLGDKGVPDFLPQLTHKKPDELRMDDYFEWPIVADHRQILQTAVRKWLAEHLDCCGAIPLVRSTEPALKFRLSDFDADRAKSRLLSLRLGMSPEEVLKIAGKPDATDRDEDNLDHWHTALLGFCTKDHNENLAYIYFFERWADEIARRDPLRDRYVIVFFSAEGKLTRMFSNVAKVAPILPPRTYENWLRLVWGASAAH